MIQHTDICIYVCMPIKTKKTTLYLDPDVYKRLKFLALKRDTEVTKIIDVALRTYLKREERK